MFVGKCIKCKEHVFGKENGCNALVLTHLSLCSSKQRFYAHLMSRATFGMLIVLHVTTVEFCCIDLVDFLNLKGKFIVSNIIRYLICFVLHCY